MNVSSRWKRMMALAAAATFVAAVGAQESRREGKPGFRVEGRVPQPVTPGKPLSGPSAGTPVDIATRYIVQQRQALGLGAADLHEMVLDSAHTSEHNGVTHIYFAQRYQGIQVYGAQINISVAADGSILTIGNSFVPQLARAVNRQAPDRSPAEALERAAKHLGLQMTGPAVVKQERGGPSMEVVLDAAGIARKDVTAKLVYQPVSVTQVRLAWLLEIEERVGADWWHMTIDAENGDVLAQENLTVYDNWGPVPTIATDEPGSTPQPLTIDTLSQLTSRPRAFDVAASASFAGVNDGSTYNVFALPLESPSHGDRSFVTNPAHPIASPFGWHDTNAAAGPEFTRTRGNNVHAYTDIDANNVADAGSDPDGGAGLQFDFPLDLGVQQPAAYRPFAVANLFYWNNIVHDVFYGYGFNEASGNFQVNIYGRGGTGGDDVRAEAQDGSGTNNANFATNVDGVRPRMQMFVWTSPFNAKVTVNPSSPIAGDYVAAAAGFGPSLGAVGPITADTVVAFDASTPDGPSTTDGCTAITNAADVAGHIAIVDRGTCGFVVKVKNAQNAGAVAVIVVNNVAGNPAAMGGADPTIVIPSVMVRLDHGTQMKDNVPFNATIAAQASISRDSDLDAGVIAHEYGHGISNRLTGGRTVVGCLSNQEQMGEGWSDWLALVLTAREGDTAAMRRGIGTYLIYQGTDGNGIRPTPYSTDMAINPSTYDTIKTAAVPHGVGYVWSTMLWDMYWNLVHKYGYNPDVYEPWHTGGNNLAIQLVMDGMKLQPCSPGFVTGRDAILQADQALTGGANQCDIWHAFARRGLGLNAAQGSSGNVLDGVQNFDIPASCQPALSLMTPASVQYSDPATLQAKVDPAWYYGQPVTGSVEFFVEGASVGSATLVGGLATLEIANARAAGNYSVTATFTPTGPDGVTASNAGPVTLVVTKEHTATDYQGDEFVVTAGPAITTAPVRLAAQLTQQDDGHAGDITLARVAFQLFKSTNLGSTPDLVVGNIPVDGAGRALTIETLPVDNWTVKVKVDAANAYWKASPVDVATITVDLGSTDRRVTGGGWVYDAGSATGKSNFGFTVSPAKNGTPRGNSIFVLRSTDGFDYVVKSTSWQGGGLSFSGNPATKASFSGRVTVQKIDRATGEVVGSFGNYRMTVDVWDGDLLTPRAADRYGITVIDTQGQVWHQVGAINAPAQVGGGNVAIKGS